VLAWDAKGRASKARGLSELTWQQLAASSKLFASTPLHEANCVIFGAIVGARTSDTQNLPLRIHMLYSNVFQLTTQESSSGCL
jgi:hypothetical protein